MLAARKTQGHPVILQLLPRKQATVLSAGEGTDLPSKHIPQGIEGDAGCPNTMAYLFRRRSKGEGNSTSSSCSSLSDDNKGTSIRSSEIEPPAPAPSKATTNGMKEIGDPSLPAVGYLPPHSISKADAISAIAAVAAGTLEGAAAGAVTAPSADRSVKKQYGQDGDGERGKEAEGGRERSGSVGNLFLSSMNSFSSCTSLSFLTGEDETPSPPETGPAGIDFSTPAHPTTQVVDFIITFLLVCTFAFRTHSVSISSLLFSWY
eukprot:evm.model.NODE_14596_length_8023_cov_27.736881.1